MTSHGLTECWNSITAPLIESIPYTIQSLPQECYGTFCEIEINTHEPIDADFATLVATSRSRGATLPGIGRLVSAAHSS